MEHWKSKYLEVGKGLNSAKETQTRREDGEENGIETTSTGWKAEGSKPPYRIARYLKYTTRLGGGFEKVTGHSPDEYAKRLWSDPCRSLASTAVVTHNHLGGQDPSIRILRLSNP